MPRPFLSPTAVRQRHKPQQHSLNHANRICGLLPRENIVGKPLPVFRSYEATTEQLNNRTHWLYHARGAADLNGASAFITVHERPEIAPQLPL